MSKSRKFTSTSRKKYSIAKHRYQEKLVNESKKITVNADKSIKYKNYI